MTEKSFVSCFDKNCEEFAELLMTLISDEGAIRNINIKKETFKKDRAITSDEYVVTIGLEGSKVNKMNFPDCYDKYGIHIGFRGKKAWICCEDYNWKKKEVNEFRKELILLLDELGMRTENIDVEIEENIKKAKVAKSTAIVCTGSLAGNIIMGSLITTLMATNIPIYLSVYCYIKNKIWNFLNKHKIREQQYKLAVVMFYHKYINEFLNISTSKEDAEKDNGMNF